MKNKWIKQKFIVFLCICAGTLWGCDVDTKNAVIGQINAGATDMEGQTLVESTGAETEAETETETVPEQEVPQLSEREQQIKEYEAKYGTEDFAAEDYVTLATLYGEEGLVKKQRDLLEKCWRLYQDQTAFDLLQNITVNVMEESDKIKAQVALMYQNLDIPEYRNEAVNMLCSDEWFGVMMPKLFEGRRNYYMNDMATGGKIVIEVGYAAADAPYSKVWYIDQMGNVVYLQKDDESVRMLTTGLSEGLYHGEYESWLCLAEKGDVFYESGMFVRNVCVGEYTAKVYFGKKKVDLYTLWSNREGMKFTTYTGEFDRDGKTLLDQSESKKLTASRGEKGDSYVIYAYTSDKSKCLFATGTAEEMMFGSQQFGISTLPTFTTYEPVIQEIPDVQIRVQDGNVEWFDGNGWQIIGEVTDFVAEDPFTDYTEKEGFATEEERENAEVTTIYDSQGAGTLKKPSSSTGSSSSGSTSSGSSGSTGSTTTTPSTTTPSTTTPSTTTPSTTPSTGGSTTGGTTSGGTTTTTPSTPSTGGSTTGGTTTTTPSTPSTGGDNTGSGTTGGDSSGGTTGGDSSGGTTGGDVDIEAPDEWTDLDP